MRRKAISVTSLLVIVAIGGGADSASASEKCRDVKNPYEGSRYDGVPLSDIEAKNITCPNARRVARNAHEKAMMMGGGDMHFTYRWEGWRVEGDLRGDHDSYVATKSDKKVSWRF